MFSLPLSFRDVITDCHVHRLNLLPFFSLEKVLDVTYF
jgi:hypothetical protein